MEEEINIDEGMDFTPVVEETEETLEAPKKIEEEAPVEAEGVPLEEVEPEQ